MTYRPRPGKVRGTEVIDAFGSTWRVMDHEKVRGLKIEHNDGGWLFGVHDGGVQIAVREVLA